MSWRTVVITSCCKLDYKMGFILYLAEDLPFEIDCQKLTICPIIKAVSPEIEEADKGTLEKIFAYMELVRILT